MSLQVHALRLPAQSNNTSTFYTSPLNGQTWQGTTEHLGLCICTAAGTFSNFKVVLVTAPGAGNSVTYTLRVNGSNTAATITISGTSTSGEYTGTPIALADGDELSLSLVQVSNPTTSACSITWDFNGTTAAQSIYGGQGDGAIAINRTNFVLYPVGNSNWNGGGEADVVACAGALTKATIKLDADVTGAGSLLFTISKNGTAQDGSGGTPDTRINFTTGTTKASATFSLSLAAGDRLTWSAVRTGSPATVRPAVGVCLTATTAGQSQFGSTTNQNLSTSATQYWDAVGSRNIAKTGDATEANRTQTLGITGIVVSNLRVALSSSPGATKSYTFNLRKNSADGGNTVTVADANTTGSNSSSTTYAAGDTLDLQVVPTNTPGLRSANWAFIQDQTAVEATLVYTMLERRTRGVGRGVQMGCA